MQTCAVTPADAAWLRVRGFLMRAMLALALLVVAHAALADIAPVFRFYNTVTGTHFYTISAAERDNVVARYPQFTYEGPVFYASPTPDAGTTPVYRFYDTKTGTHFYTASDAERDGVRAGYPDYVYEGPVYFVPLSPGDGRTPLFRFYNTRTGAHFYTISTDERDHVIATWPWFTYEGTAYLVWTGGTGGGAVADADAWRLLDQATFGASAGEAARVKGMGIAAWIEDQFTQPESGYPDAVYNRLQIRQTIDCGQRDAGGAPYPAGAPQAICYRDELTPTGMSRNFFTNAVGKPDQLRQRVAWALSQIQVISSVESDLAAAYPMTRYQNILFDEAFGNFESLLNRITLSPAMGNWLDMVNNDKPNPSTGRVPNENYAREILQLFSIGLTELNPDGTPRLDAAGKPIPTYTQDTIKQFARVFTGWTYPNPDGSPATKKNAAYYAAPMVAYPNGHDTDPKSLLSGVTLPAGQSIQQDLAAAVHNIFMHPNVGPFIGKQLIQKLVTGNPAPAYVARVAQAFNDNGQGTRGDMKAVIRAVLLDPEARGAVKTDPAFGALREPVLLVTGMVRALGGTTDGFDLANRTSALGQRPYASPTVFNFYTPDTTIPGTAILGPEFGIHNSNSAVGRANLVYALVYGGIAPDPTVPNPIGTHLDLTPFQAVAGDPAAVTDAVSKALIGAPLPSAARDLVIAAVTSVSATDLVGRARMATYLVASSYHYQVRH